MTIDRDETELTDPELVARIGTGSDREAEAVLFRRMAPRVRLYGLRHLRDAHAADDLAQQVMITVLLALRDRRVQDPEKLPSFVMGTSRMCVLNLRRGALRKQNLLETFGSEFATTFEHSTLHLDEQRLTECVQTLREREKAVVIMTFYDELSGADVSGFLGISEANVRVVRHRAIQLLRICMGVTA
jgi:RNA polymerase sigma-70 factor, ECF subfamily